MSYKKRYQIKNRRRSIFADIISIFAALAAVITIWIGAANIDYYPVPSSIAITLAFVLMAKIMADRDFVGGEDD